MDNRCLASFGSPRRDIDASKVPIIVDVPIELRSPGEPRFVLVNHSTLKNIEKPTNMKKLLEYIKTDRGKMCGPKPCSMASNIAMPSTSKSNDRYPKAYSKEPQYEDKVSQQRSFRGNKLGNFNKPNDKLHLCSTQRNINRDHKGEFKSHRMYVPERQTEIVDVPQSPIRRKYNMQVSNRPYLLELPPEFANPRYQRNVPWEFSEETIHYANPSHEFAVQSYDHCENLMCEFREKTYSHANFVCDLGEKIHHHASVPSKLPQPINLYRKSANFLDDHPWQTNYSSEFAKKNDRHYSLPSELPRPIYHLQNSSNFLDDYPWGMNYSSVGFLEEQRYLDQQLRNCFLEPYQSVSPVYAKEERSLQSYQSDAPVCAYQKTYPQSRNKSHSQRKNEHGNRGQKNRKSQWWK